MQYFSIAKQMRTKCFAVAAVAMLSLTQSQAEVEMGEDAAAIEQQQLAEALQQPPAIVENVGNLFRDKIENPSTIREFFINNLIDELGNIVEADRSTLRSHVRSLILAERHNHPKLSRVSQNEDNINEVYEKFGPEQSPEIFEYVGAELAANDANRDSLDIEGSFEDFKDIMSRALSEASTSYAEHQETLAQEPVPALNLKSEAPVKEKEAVLVS